MTSFHALVAQHAQSHPGKAALVQGALRHGYPELAERSGRLAVGLAQRGVGEGGRVLWLGQNASLVVELFLACSRLGAVLCCANWRQSATELAFVLDDFAPALVLQQGDGELAETVAAARALASVSAEWVNLPLDGDPGEPLLAVPEDAELPAVAPDPSRALLAIYTAAFDGHPSAALLSEQGLFLQAMVHVVALEVTSADVVLVTSPLFHILGWLDLLPVLLLGGTVVVVPRAEPETVLEVMARERVTTGTIHPPTIEAIVPLNAARGLDISNFRSALRMPGWAEMTRPGRGIGGYGQTEVCGPVLVGAFAGEGSTPFCGRPSPFVEVRIVDEDDADVPPGETGEILLRGPVVGLGYWNRPEVNAARRTADGWWRTRDLGRRDPDGTVSFVGTKVHFIKTGGENVYPAEVESVLLAHPAVQQVAVIGTADPTWAQIVTAVIVLAPGAEATRDELVAHARQKLAGYKVPRIVPSSRRSRASGRWPTTRPWMPNSGAAIIPVRASAAIP